MGILIGESPKTLDMPGVDALAKEPIRPKKIVTGGGGVIGCETAWYLARNLSHRYLLRELRDTCRDFNQITGLEMQ
jgi:pyruvate/2-oxoglutarate dehydrogenase complex dihydrolipoamide dehydrogenase (E3) component